MSHFPLDDDFFSPVRFDTSAVDKNSDSSDGSLNDLLNAEESSLIDFKNKVSTEKDMTKSPDESELKIQDKNIIKSESANAFTPVLNEDSLDKSNGKRHSSILKLEKLKDTKTATMKKGNIKSQQKAQESSSRENILDSNSTKPNIAEKLHQKKSRTASLLSKNENTRFDSLKNVNKRQKSNNQSSKNCYEDVMAESNSSLKKLSDNFSNPPEKVSDIKLKNSSVISTESNKHRSQTNLDNKKSNISSQQKEKLTVNPLHASYEATIEKMIRSCISSESAKIRQLMYMQQMSFYRELNKIKDKMEKQHLVTTGNLLNVIEELVQMNTSLKLGLSNKV